MELVWETAEAVTWGLLLALLVQKVQGGVTLREFEGDWV